MLSTARLILSIGACFACLGCGGADWHADTYPASGSVIINGKPAAGAVVELHSTGQKPDVRNSRPWAVVREDGSYTLSTYYKDDGAPPGVYKMTVKWPPDVTKPSFEDRLRGKFSNPQTSEWTVTIEESNNELPPIEISGAPVDVKDVPARGQRRSAGPVMPR